ncbi:unnamed protein product [Fraxinus pennsylvanica]|uniref:Uncharacterized protein n=1 Tax=Fraxinus pennsylvanica TaxID=56036 RepID=A0AAD1YZE6_9LAMI|nr:unnamed protein product [Fraxinus pennsylvanica]
MGHLSSPLSSREATCSWWLSFVSPVGEPSELAPAVFPCLSSWGEEEISEREKQERELCGYGSGEVVCKERDIGMGPLGYRTQADSNPLIIRLFGDEYCPQLGQDLHQDGEDHPYGGIITAENMPMIWNR